MQFLAKEMGIFEGRKERSDCLVKLYKAWMNFSPTSVSCGRVFSIQYSLLEGPCLDNRGLMKNKSKNMDNFYVPESLY